MTTLVASLIIQAMALGSNAWMDEAKTYQHFLTGWLSPHSSSVGSLLPDSRNAGQSADNSYQQMKDSIDRQLKVQFALATSA